MKKKIQLHQIKVENWNSHHNGPANQLNQQKWAVDIHWSQEPTARENTVKNDDQLIHFNHLLFSRKLKTN